MDKAENKQRDTWSKLDFLIKAFGVLFISGALTFYGIYSENRRAETEIQVTNLITKSEFYADARTNRRSADAALKTDLTRNMVARIFDNSNPEEKLLALELLANNLHEALDLKPLFHSLYLDNRSDDIMQERLLLLANDLRARQKERLGSQIVVKERFHLNFEQEPKHFSISGDSVIVELLDIHNNNALLGITISSTSSSVLNDLLQIKPRKQTTELAITVGRFDMPFVDYLAFGNFRYAFMFDGMDSTDQALIEFVAYPGDFFDIEDRLAVDRLLSK